MYNESPLIRRQWEILYKANTLISTYERNIAELEAMFASKQEEAKQKYEYLMEEYTKREREVEGWKRSAESIATKNSINKFTRFGGNSQAKISSKATPIEQIDDLLEKAKKEYSLLANSLREDSRKSPASCLFWLTALTVISAVVIYSFTYPSYSFDSSGIELFGLFSILFFICGIGIRFSMWADRRNHYTAILLALDSARTILQERIEGANAKENMRSIKLKQDVEAKNKKLRENFDRCFKELDRDVKNYVQETGILGADWQDEVWKQWHPSVTASKGNIIRCGKVVISYQQQHTQSFPLFIPFPAGKSILLLASRESYDIAHDSYYKAMMFLQSLLLRIVTTKARGTIQFTFFDPLDFGSYITPFMKLSGFNSALGNSHKIIDHDHIKIIDYEHIKEHLTKLAQFLADMNYKETPTIELYNEQHPQNPLPYRILVVLGFPSEFSSGEVVQKLFNIARVGPTYGVYPIILCDIKQVVNSSITLEDFAHISLTFRWEGQQVYWDDIRSELQIYSDITL